MSDIYHNKTRDVMPDSPNEKQARVHMQLIEDQVSEARAKTGKFIKPTMKKAESGEAILPQ